MPMTRLLDFAAPNAAYCCCDPFAVAIGPWRAFGVMLPAAAPNSMAMRLAVSWAIHGGRRIATASDRTPASPLTPSSGAVPGRRLQDIPSYSWIGEHGSGFMLFVSPCADPATRNPRPYYMSPRGHRR